MKMTALITLAETLPYGDGWVGSWSPGIGAPTFVGWFTVFAYFLAALACWKARAFAGGPSGLRRKERAFWTTLSVVLLLLCANKQLDLQTAFTEFMRAMAKRQGWYDVRFAYQKGFIAAMAIGAVIGGWLCLRFTRDLPRSVKTAGVGLVVIACFVLVRAASFHHIDRLLGQTVLLLKVNWLLELGGIAIVLMGAMWRGPGIHSARSS